MPPNETLVAMQTENGFRVYNPADSANIVLVTGTARVANCTCPDFKENVQIDHRYQCRHIEAVIGQLPHPTEDGPTPEEERAAIQSEGSALRETAAPPAMMTLKRSVSPDGRIDSLSIEVTLALPATVNEIKMKALKTLTLQDELAEAFVREHAPNRPEPNGHQPNGNGNGQGYAPNGNGQPANGGYGNGRGNGNGHSHSNGGASTGESVPATFVNIEGMQTRNGWSCYINVDVNGEQVRLFGKKNELGDAIRAAGFPNLAGNIQQGVQLNLPCRVILSQNGRYYKVERIMPAQGQPAQAGSQGGYRGGYGR